MAYGVLASHFDRLFFVPGNARILICGRNKASAERIIATFPKTPNSQYEFVECDASLMKNVVKAAADIKSRVGGPINYLVLSQGIMTTNGFDATAEGIDRKMSLHFYSRWKVSTLHVFIFASGLTVIHLSL